MGSLLEARHVTKEYDGRTIIRDISIHLERGELISLLGLSGSGKTTLFHVLSGLTRPETGQVLFGGEDITGRPGSVSYMQQKDLLLAHKKVIDNVSLPLVLRGIRKKEARSAAEPLFAQFGIEGTQYQYPAQLSGGMRQRAAFLRTYLSAARTGHTEAGGEDGGSHDNCGAALLDEPFSALDTITKSQMHSWYLDMMQRIDLSTIFITHDIDEAILLSDRIYLMTGNPGVIEHEIRIQTPRPERKEYNLTQEFLDYKRQIIRILGSGF
ncbi:MAG: ABC transporter ATP-binding protein [Lachnospiraceae bacterium]|nr:ABC transporter ATP-binding protein [Lachnospiraceae bacterium]